MATWLSSYLSGDQKGSSGLPPVTALQEQRSKQITSMWNLNPNVVEIKVQAEYRINITQQGHNIALHIILPPQFPQEKPVVRVSPPVRHPWVSQNMEVIGCPRLNTFGVHTDLGRVVKDIIQEFTQNPPMVFPGVSNQQVSSPPMSSYPPYSEVATNQVPMVPPSYNSFQPMQNPPGQPQDSFRPQWPPMTAPQLPPMTAPQLPPMTAPQLPPMTAPQLTAEPTGSISHIDFPSSIDTAEQNISTASEADRNLFVKPNTPPPLLQGPSNCYQIPDTDESFNILDDLSSGDLQLLLDDERKFMEIFQYLPGLNKFFQERNELYNICQELAKHNLGCKPELERRKKTLKESEDEQVTLNEKFQNNCSQQQRLNRECDPRNLLDNLRVAAADAEQSSDLLAEDFMAGKLPLQEFLRQYSDKRTAFHLRKVKEEKLSQMINDRTIRY